jgi:hypothetical protein
LLIGELWFALANLPSQRVLLAIISIFLPGYQIFICKLELILKLEELHKENGGLAKIEVKKKKTQNQ